MRNAQEFLLLPPFSLFTEVPNDVRFPRKAPDGSRLGHNFAARMASRRLSKTNSLTFNIWNSFSLLQRSAWIALATAKIVDFPLKRTELSKSHEIPRVRGDHSDPQAGGAHCNQRIIRQPALSNFLVIIRVGQTGQYFAGLGPVVEVGTRIRLAFSKSRSKGSSTCRPRGAIPVYSSSSASRCSRFSSTLPFTLPLCEPETRPPSR